MVLKNREVQSGFLLLLVSGVMFTATLSFKKMTTTAIGPAFMPQVISILIALVSLAVIYEGYKKVKAAKEVDSTIKAEDAEAVDKGVSYKPVIVSFVLMAFYVVIMPIVGFLITTAVFMFIQMMVLSSKLERRWLLFAVVSVVSSVIIYYVFRNVFYIMLPSGLL
ncbi:tripartite tricarboxylate transporter TctB family protein [Sporosarcina luteola]|uniref:tripartite tricarboxylate transporter TctB family protein n=1 Tax=Sporosarcina luteola TaxID=582850 RepID=UPI00203C6357|nr:tripartite tricarboxylate transporter TctB family protein [Sporosarcina luteola]MCM3636605.1 tripartite tricarboxylate transporter TctB family protein [Sporosarcina luteola]